jgi:hypothetical protein
MVAGPTLNSVAITMGMAQVRRLKKALLTRSSRSAATFASG